MKNSKLITPEILKRVDGDLKCSQDKSPEVKILWYPLCIQIKHKDVYKYIEDWISSIANERYLTPIYRTLSIFEQRDLATQWFMKYRNSYSPQAIVAIC